MTEHGPVLFAAAVTMSSSSFLLNDMCHPIRCSPLFITFFIFSIRKLSQNAPPLLAFLWCTEVVTTTQLKVEKMYLILEASRSIIAGNISLCTRISTIACAITITIAISIYYWMKRRGELHHQQQ